MKIMNSFLCFAFFALAIEGCGAVNPESLADIKKLKAHLVLAEHADTILQAEKRCLNYPDIPGLTWDVEIIRARCALQRDPVLSLVEIEQLVGSEKGREFLENRYAALLNAHYTDAQRDQIFVSTSIFRDDRNANNVVDQWITGSPDSAYANLAAGLRKLGEAQAVRGERSASETAISDMKTMEKFAQQAEIFLKKSWKIEPRLSPACEALATVQRMIYGGEVAGVTAEACVKQDPFSYFTVMAWKSSTELRWGGDGFGFPEIKKHIERYGKANPMLKTVNTAIQAEPYQGTSEQLLPGVLDQLHEAIKYGPNSLVLNQISSAYYQMGDLDNGLAYLSQAVRFNIDFSSYRYIRARRNLITKPRWAAYDYEILLLQNPTSYYARYYLAFSRQLEQKRKAGYVTKGVVKMDAESVEVQIITECEDYILRGKSNSLMDQCLDNIVLEFPDNPEAWRARAETLHYLGKPGALDAAKKYLDMVDHETFGYEVNEKRFKNWFSKGTK
jgi:hypothetical protein